MFRYGDRMLTAYGVIALTFMMAMYALEQRHRHFVLAFAVGCALSSSYGFLSGAWPFGVVEGVWTVVAIRRWAAMPSGLQWAGGDEGRYPATGAADLP
jgi:hypothetical protein